MGTLLLLFCLCFAALLTPPMLSMAHEIKPPPGRPAEDLKTPEMPDRSLGPVGVVAGRRSVEVVEGSMVVDDDDEELPVALSVVDESHLRISTYLLKGPRGGGWAMECGGGGRNKDGSLELPIDNSPELPIDNSPVNSSELPPVNSPELPTNNSPVMPSDNFHANQPPISFLPSAPPLEVLACHICGYPDCNILRSQFVCPYCGNMWPVNVYAV
ncbi:hypothetical protein C1H46_005384 [Malus baccata]|uniref:Uncharacterized protein n=1 Tax=Malus baccata TaxID=106549 RepID=A0A540ND91_MALBA|nr:hypothetical protein C1H46_005384 [Malus baccata]